MTDPTPDLTTPAGVAAHLGLPLDSVVSLSGGFANFTYRSYALLPSHPHPHPHPHTLPQTCIIKYAASYLAGMASMFFSDTRIIYEAAALSALSDFPHTAVTTPHVIHWDEQARVLVMSDSGEGTTTLKQTLCGTEDRDWDKIGDALGKFLWTLHERGRCEAGQGLLKKLGENKQAVDMWLEVTYDRLADSFPARRELLTEIAAAAPEAGKKTLTTVHGDFWTGNVLLSPKSSIDTQVTVVDWEMSKVWNTWGDVGQMCAELYLPTHFKGRQEGRVVLDAFLKAYCSEGGEGGIDEETARWAVMHFGVHFIVWTRSTGWGEGDEEGKEKVESVVEMGMEYIEHGWRREWGWVKGSVMGGLVREEWIR